MHGPKRDERLEFWLLSRIFITACNSARRDEGIAPPLLRFRIGGVGSGRGSAVALRKRIEVRALKIAVLGTHGMHKRTALRFHAFARELETLFGRGHPLEQRSNNVPDDRIVEAA